MHLPYTSQKIVLDLISVADCYESFLKYPIPEKKTHDTRTSLRSWAWAWLSRAPCPRPRTLAMLPILVLYPTQKVEKKALPQACRN